MVAIACLLNQSSVGVPLHCVVETVLCLVEGSSIEYALASTVSPKRRCGVIMFFGPSAVLIVVGCRWLDGVIRLSFLLVVALRSRIVGSIPTTFCFVVFVASVAFKRGVCSVVFGSLNFQVWIHLSCLIFQHSALMWPNLLQ